MNLKQSVSLFPNFRVFSVKHWETPVHYAFSSRSILCCEGGDSRICKHFLFPHMK